MLHQREEQYRDTEVARQHTDVSVRPRHKRDDRLTEPKVLPENQLLGKQFQPNKLRGHRASRNT